MINEDFPVHLQNDFNTQSLIESPFWELSTTQNAPVPVLATYAALTRGLQYRPGTDANMTFQTFVPSIEPKAGNTVSTTVAAFQPWISCQTSEARLNGPALALNSSAPKKPLYPITLNTDPCAVYQKTTNQSQSPGVGYSGTYPYLLPVTDPRSNPVSSHMLNGNISQIECADSPSTGSRYPILWFLYDVAYSQEDASNTTSWSVAVRNISALVCMPEYTVKNVTVTYSPNDSGKQGVYAITEDRFPDSATTLAAINDSSLFELFSENLSADTPLLYSQEAGSTGPESNIDPWNAFQFVSNITGKDSVQELLGDAEALRKGAQDVYAGVLTQWAKDNIMTPTNTPVQASMHYIENRLHVRESAVVTMIVGLGLIVLLTALLVLLRPSARAPNGSGPLQQLAQVLSVNHPLDRILSGAKFPQSAVVKRLLEPFNLDGGARETADCRPILEGHPVPPTVTNAHEKAEISTEPSEWGHWYRPVFGRRGVVALVVAFPIILIIILEVLQRLSDKHDGFITCGPDTASGFSTDVWTHYLPTLVLVLVATCYDALENCVLTLSPLIRLRAGSVLGLVKADTKLYAALPPIALWTSVRRRYLGAALIIVATLTGSWLSVVSAGLYAAHPVSASRAAMSFAMDRIDVAWNATNGDNGAATTTSLIAQLNLTYPQWTYGELAFPTIKLTQAGTEQGSLKTRLPAHRASLNCNVLSSDQYNVTIDPEDEGIPPQAAVTTTIDLPPHCRSNVSTTTMEIRNTISMTGISNDHPSGVYAGQLQNIYASGQFNNADSLQVSKNGVVLPDGCPSISLVFGYFALNSTMFAAMKAGEIQNFDITGPAKANITNMICTQTMHQVDTDVVLNLPSLTFSPAQPPIPDEATVQVLTNGTPGVTALSYHIESNLLTSLTTFTNAFLRGSTVDASPLDPFFEAVLFGAHAVPAPQLTGPDNIEKLLNASNSLYAMYMAQAIDANMRQPAGSSANKTFNGTVTNPSHFRLQQNSAAKLALQAMLAAMAVCGALAYVLSRGMSAVLPQTDVPCSLGATMGLLAGTRLCQEVALHGKCGGQVSLEEVLKEREFRLGWWHVQTGAFEAEIGGLKEEERGEYRYRIDVLRRGEEGGWI